MPESTCLHIQDRESGPIRVVEMPWISVRIGRAAYCEVQLTELDLAEEVCRLLRRGRSWHLVPDGKGSPIRLEGRSLSGCCLLPFDVPFFVGSYCLTLRHDRAAEPDWGTYPSKAPSQPERTATLIRPRPPDRRGVEPEEPDRPLPRAPSLVVSRRLLSMALRPFTSRCLRPRSNRRRNSLTKALAPHLRQSACASVR